MLPVLVLTAGFGKRLDPLTRLIAKPAVPLAGRTLIERVLDWLRAQGVTDAVLNLHHRPETVTSVIGDGAHLGLRIRYSWEMPLLGSAGGPRHALPLLGTGTFLIVNGDTLCDVPLDPMIAAHRFSGADITMAVVPNPAPDRYNGMLIDDDDRITGVVGRGHAEPSWHFVGIQVASAPVFEGLPDNVPAESVHGIYKPLIGLTKGGLRAYRVNSAFVDVGTPRDYLHAALTVGDGATIEPRAIVEPGARVTNTVVWSGATIGEGARLDRCIVTDVNVPPGFEARNKVIVRAAVLRDGDAATVVGDAACFEIDR